MFCKSGLLLIVLQFFSSFICSAILLFLCLFYNSSLLQVFLQFYSCFCLFLICYSSLSFISHYAYFNFHFLIVQLIFHSERTTTHSHCVFLLCTATPSITPQIPRTMLQQLKLQPSKNHDLVMITES